MEPIVFIDSLDNISIVNLNVPALSASPPPTFASESSTAAFDLLESERNASLLCDHLDDDRLQRAPFASSESSSVIVSLADERRGGRRTTSSLDKVRTWKKYKNKKHLSQTELDRKRDLANKQERRRMHRLNDALNRLRQVLRPEMRPSFERIVSSHQVIPAELQHPPPRRLSKIKTLQSAIRYIQRLQELLSNH
ncbi:neurogenic differentiation factor 6-A-like isoform X1 [Oppia nitens]|uniref:neurogenic differentiation factor 6-A-like isoform X1 n=1 Tax=Oppia nitens TaxID=1686743 RepID=UPI0023DB7E35|nr:neurogenic differentiation factor 6-A-like isoform X1 [Oppia nitens]